MKLGEILGLLFLFGWIASWIAFAVMLLTYKFPPLLSVPGIITLVGVIIWLLVNIYWTVWAFIIAILGGE